MREDKEKKLWENATCFPMRRMERRKTVGDMLGKNPASGFKNRERSKQQKQNQQTALQKKQQEREMEGTREVQSND